MGVLIDASFLVAQEQVEADLQARTHGREDEPFFLSVITVSDLLEGAHRPADGVARARRSVFVEAVIDRFPVLPLDLPTARAHSELRAELEAAGAAIDPHDLWLAAVARAHGLSLATADARDFGLVPGLVVEDWSS